MASTRRRERLEAAAAIVLGILVGLWYLAPTLTELPWFRDWVRSWR
jgi:hypothetical protein